jgi:hypothetical protein
MIVERVTASTLRMIASKHVHLCRSGPRALERPVDIPGTIAKMG